MDKIPGLVSIVVPVYNCIDYLDGCINSLLSQSYTNIEIIICDDYSTDGSREKLSEYEGNPKVKVLFNDQNMHQAYTRNRCLEMCSGEYVMMQDADDVSETNRIERLIASFEDGIDFVSSACYWFDENGKYREWITSKVYPDKNDLLWGIPHVHAATMFRTECLKKIGGYRVGKHLSRSEDYDLMMRLYADGFRGKNIPDVLYGYRVDRETIRRRNFKMAMDECHVRANGFKINGIMFPRGWFFVFKPIASQLVQNVKLLTHNR